MFLLRDCVSGFFYLIFFWTPINSVISIFAKIREHIRNERCTTGGIDTGGICIERGDTVGNLPTVSMTPPALPMSTTPPAVYLLFLLVNIDHTVKSSTTLIEHFVNKTDLKTATQLVSNLI